MIIDISHFQNSYFFNTTQFTSTAHIHVSKRPNWMRTFSENKYRHFFSCLLRLIEPKYKSLIMSTYLGTQRHKFQNLQAWTVPSRVEYRKLYLNTWRWLFKRKSWIFSYDSPKMSENAIKSDIFRCWGSSFSVSVEWISCVKDSIDKPSFELVFSTETKLTVCLASKTWYSEIAT